MERLPIDDALADIAAALQSTRGVVIEAPPGSGKTTRVPPSLLQAPWALNKQIVVLEPRRLAARLAARRVAQELEQPVGQDVGYQVRFENVTSPHTRLRFVTEGVFVRQLLASPHLDDVAAVVIDEFHERHVQADLALAWVKHLRASSRPDLRLVVMSATLEAGPIARFLDDCPVIRVEGRRFDVRIDYLERPAVPALSTEIASAVRTQTRAGLEGNVLVFLPGAAEIRDAMKACEPVAASEDLEVVALHGDLPSNEQDRALAPSTRRKVILSTNVAETSITIENVVAVIDSGLARVASHAPWSGLPMLRVAPISQASAAQRAGRAGRTRDGVCLRLYTKADHHRRAAHDPPEIARMDLVETMLILKALGVADTRSFAWLQEPPQDAWSAAERLLALLGAIEPGGALSPLGRQLLRFPVHPRIGRILAESERRGIAELGATIAAVLGERDLQASQRAQVTHGGGGPRLAQSYGKSDVLSAVEQFHQAQDMSFSRDVVRAMGLDRGALLAVDRARSHLLRLTRNRSEPPADREEQALLCILCGFPDRVARRVRERELTLVGGGSALLAASSEVQTSEFVVAVDAEERQDGRGRRLVVRQASAVEPEWLLELFPDRIQEAREVQWDAQRERVEVSERLLYDTLVLDTSSGKGKGSPEASKVLADAAQAKGLHAFVGDADLSGWLERVAFAARVAPEGGWPEMSEAIATQVLRQLCEGKTSFAQVKEAGLLEALRQRLDARQRSLLERLAPERMRLPGGRSVKIHYEADKPPWIESRLQDFFGLTRGPAIADGKIPLVLHLLAPNQRAVQVTSDLAGFWERAYPEVRRQLSRRYPKHTWPEDGAKASPPAPRRPGKN